MVSARALAGGRLAVRIGPAQFFIPQPCGVDVQLSRHQPSTVAMMSRMKPKSLCFCCSVITPEASADAHTRLTVDSSMQGVPRERLPRFATLGEVASAASARYGLRIARGNLGRRLRPSCARYVGELRKRMDSRVQDVAPSCSGLAGILHAAAPYCMMPLSMRMRGLEPPQSYLHTDLNRARLPIPPHPQAGKAATIPQDGP